MDPLAILTSFVVVLLFGILASLLSKKLGIANILLLIIVGSLLSDVARFLGFIDIPQIAMVVLSVIALVLIIFEGSSKFDINELNNFSFKALTMLLLFMLFNILFLAPTFTFFFAEEATLKTFLFGCIFAIIVIATDAPAIFYMLKDRRNKAVEFLEVESIIDTPIIVILPFLILDLIGAIDIGGTLDWGSYGVAFLNQIIVGLGAGLITGIVFFKIMKKFYDHAISPLSLITAALLAYILAENLHGSGVISVAVLGFMFGNTYLARKDSLAQFNNMLSNSLEIIVFMLVGFIISLRMPLETYLLGLIAFIIILFARYLAVRISLRKDNYTKGEIWFLTLIIPKGIAAATMVFSLSLLSYEPLTFVLELLVLTIVYSIILATIVSKFSNKFIKINLQ